MSVIITKTFRHLPGIAALVVTGVLFWSLASPSSNPDIFIFSYLRFAVLAAIGSIFIFIAASFCSSGVKGIVDLTTVSLIATVALVEVSLRLSPSLLPDQLLPYLPEAARREIASERAFFSQESISGSGMVFHWKPNATFKHRPWITVDKLGYRNRVTRSDKADVVLLGASVILASDVEKNLSHWFDKDGVSNLSLAMGQYAPQHYAEVYDRYVLKTGLKHKVVLVLVIMPYELDKSILYQRVVQNGGDYRSYLTPLTSVTRSIPLLDSLWFSSLVRYAQSSAIAAIQSRQDGTSVRMSVGESRTVVPKDFFVPQKRGAGWTAASAAFTKIIQGALANQAKPIFIYYPDSAVRLLPYADLATEEKEAFQRAEAENRRTLKSLVEGAGGQFVDLVEAFQRQAQERNINQSLLDYHLNDEGTEFLYSLLRPVLGPLVPDQAKE